MLDLITSYKSGKLQYSKLVRDLEGIMDASDIRDISIITEWYDLWSPLEIENALNGNKTDIQNIIGDIVNLETFIIKEVQKK